MPHKKNKYCIDTSSILEWFVRSYPPDVFKNIPGYMEELILEGRHIAPKEVMNEIKPGDEVHNWAKRQSNLFHDEDEDVQIRVAALMAQYSIPEKPTKGIRGADPFVIAMGLTQQEATIIVSDEKAGTKENPKFPFVCKAEGIECITFLEMMRREKWEL